MYKKIPKTFFKKGFVNKNVQNQLMNDSCTWYAIKKLLKENIIFTIDYWWKSISKYKYIFLDIHIFIDIAYNPSDDQKY